MTCNDEQAALLAMLRARDPRTLTSDELDQILRHADECPHCSTELRNLAARAVLAQSPVARLDPARSARLRARVLAHAAGERAPSIAHPRPRRTLPRRASGWMAAATLGIALLTHHGFHEPLSSGWLAAAGFAAVALGLGVYAAAQ